MNPKDRFLRRNATRFVPVRFGAALQEPRRELLKCRDLLSCWLRTVLEQMPLAILAPAQSAGFRFNRRLMNVDGLIWCLPPIPNTRRAVVLNPLLTCSPRTPRTGGIRDALMRVTSWTRRRRAPRNRRTPAA